MITKIKNNLFILALSYILLIIFLYFTSYKFFISDFLKIENEQNKNNISTILNIVDQNIDNLKNTINDYSKWDDSYQFIQDKNKEYIYDNFREGTTTLEDLNIEGIIYHTLDNNIIFSKYAANFSKEKNKNIENFIINKYKEKKEISSIIYFDSKIYYYSKSSILKSDKTGEAKGYISAFKHFNLNDFNNKQAIFKSINFTNLKTDKFTFQSNLENIPNTKILVKDTNKLLTNIIQFFDLNDEYIISLEVKNDRDLIINSRKTIYIFNFTGAIILLIIFYFIFKNQYLIENQNRLLSEQVENKTKELNIAFRKLKDKNEELYTLANVDALTKIKNRRSFFIESEKKLEEAIQNNKNLCILIIDIDHFKSINDNYGHAIGDKVLIEFSIIVSSLLEKKMIFGRIGGEEFCITFFDKTIEEVEKISESIRKKCEESIIKIEDKNINFTVSMGLSQRDDLIDIDKIIHNSDELLYKAKSLGRNKIIRTTR